MLKWNASAKHDAKYVEANLSRFKVVETMVLIEPRYEKTGFLHMRDQRLCFRFTIIRNFSALNNSIISPL